MNTITVNASMRSRLDNLESPLEFCDESGQRLGFFIPASEHHRTLYELAQAALSDEDLAEARRQTGGSTTEQLLARLMAE